MTVVHPGGVRTKIAANARISGPDPDGTRVREIRRFEKALTLPPEEAARLIVRAIETRKPRLVITRLARTADRLARLAPARYWAISRRISAGRDR